MSSALLLSCFLPVQIGGSTQSPQCSTIAMFTISHKKLCRDRKIGINLSEQEPDCMRLQLTGLIKSIASRRSSNSPPNSGRMCARRRGTMFATSI